MLDCRWTVSMLRRSVCVCQSPTYPRRSFHLQGQRPAASRNLPVADIFPHWWIALLISLDPALCLSLEFLHPGHPPLRHHLLVSSRSFLRMAYLMPLPSSHQRLSVVWFSMERGHARSHSV